jgi:hypothetical protein
VLMSRWVAGHDRVSVLMRVLERRLVHFKAHPWQATTEQVFKSTARFDQSPQIRTRYTRRQKERWHQTTTKQNSTFLKSQKKEPKTFPWIIWNSLLDEKKKKFDN